MAEVIEVSSSESESQNGDSSNVASPALQRELEECLATIQGTGTFAVFEPAHSAPNPGLYIKDAGVIGLPLSDRDAQAIVAASHQAPFGKGEETIVDTAVRKTWELSPTDFELRNPAWQPFVNSIVERVSVGLGVDINGNGVTAQLYKMLLYDEGAMFKPHQDSEKAPRMFATLVIALPSKHEGGEVRITHASKTEVFATSTTSEFGYSYLAWFADVTHEVKPVGSGRRLVLTYNLMHDTLSSKQIGAKVERTLSKLDELLKGWKDQLEQPTVPKVLGYLFEHQYTEANLRYDSLKGHDQAVVAHLRDVCYRHGFLLYIASLEKSIFGACDLDEDGYDSDGCDDDCDGHCDSNEIHSIFEELERETKLKKVFDLEGCKIAEDLHFDEGNFIQKSLFEDASPDNEDFSGFTGNEGVSTTHFYHRTVAVIVPQSRRIDFILDLSEIYKDDCFSTEMRRHESTVIQWLERLTNELKTDESAEGTESELRQLCNAIIRQYRARTPQCRTSMYASAAPFNNEIVSGCLEAAVMLKDKDLFLDVYSMCSHDISSTGYNAIGTALIQHNLESLLPKYVALSKFQLLEVEHSKNPPSVVEVWADSAASSRLKSQLAKISSFSRRLSTIEDLRRGIGRETSYDPKVYLDFLKEELGHALSSMTLISPEDGVDLAKYSVKIPRQAIFNEFVPEFTSWFMLTRDSILPAVKRNSSQTLMCISFLSTLFDASVDLRIPEDIIHALCKDIIADIAPSFSLFSDIERTSDAPNKKFTYQDQLMLHERRSRLQAPSVGQEHPENVNLGLLGLFRICISLNLRTELEEIVTRLTREASTCSLESFELLYLPFLKRLEPILRDMQVLTDGSPAPRLFQLLLSTYVVRFVGAEPKPPKDWSRKTVSCDCADCGRLNEFLRNPVRMEQSFAMSKKRRTHLERQLNPSHVYYGFSVGHYGSENTPDVVTSTQARGNPHSLVVLKTQAQFKHKHAEWVKRCTLAKNQLRSIGEPYLRQYLGSMYEAVTSLDEDQLVFFLKASEAEKQENPSLKSESSSDRVPPPITNRKVPAAAHLLVSDQVTRLD